jgi:hypothetical protein
MKNYNYSIEWGFQKIKESLQCYQIIDTMLIFICKNAIFSNDLITIKHWKHALTHQVINNELKDYIIKSQSNESTMTKKNPRILGFLWSFWFFSINCFWNEIFCNILLKKLRLVPSTSHFFVNIYLILMIF